MKTTKQIAKHLREVYFGGNWTCVNLKDTLSDVTWNQAITQVNDFNTIAKLTNHITYYVSAVLKVLRGMPLIAKDSESFTHAPIQSVGDWESMLLKAWEEAKEFSDRIEVLPDSKLWEILEDEKYGIYFRNLFGIIEHAHYHLGQIVLIKKMIASNK